MNLHCIILHVEDSDDDSFLFQRVLSRLAFAGIYRRVSTIDFAFDYLSGVGSFTDRQQFPEPDVVVIDHSLPGRRSTHELAQWLTSGGTARKVPLIMLTGAMSLAEQQKWLAEGISSVFLKGITLPEMVAVVGSILELCPARTASPGPGGEVENPA